MAKIRERSGLRQPPETAIIRRPSIKIVVERWDWTKGFIDTIDITEAVMSYKFQKTIKSPSGGATLQLLPQNMYRHYLDDIAVMDVVKIFEFDTLKFQGYIRRIGASGYIDQQGKPHRSASLQCTSMGGYLIESVLSVDMSTFRNNLDFQESAEELANAIAKAGQDAISYNALVNKLIDVWFDFIDSQTSGLYTEYFERYVNFTEAMTKSDSPGYPREMFLFYGSDDDVTLWSIIEKLAEVPLNEFFFDEGPRTVHINGTDQELQNPITYLIGRQTPFDGSIGSTGAVENRFQVMSAVVIPQPYLIKFDFNKSMNEVYSVYLTAPSVYDMSKLELLAEGREEIDQVRMDKYLYRLCNKPLYYVTLVDHGEGEGARAELHGKQVKLFDRAKAVSTTLKNWYEHNDEYLSGTIDFMVPSSDDPRIGDKIGIEGIDGHFYAEGISHSWNYQGPLQAQATVTRGWRTGTGPMELKNRIFKRPKSSYWQLDSPRGKIR